MKSKLISTFARIIKQKYPLVGVPVIIKNSKGEILLGKRGKTSPCYASHWGLPGGLVEYNEYLHDAAMREVYEELGVKIKILKRSKYLYERKSDKECPVHSIDVVFHAKIISGIPGPKDETQDVRWFKPSEIKKTKLAYIHKYILQQEGLIK